MAAGSQNTYRPRFHLGGPHLSDNPRDDINLYRDTYSATGVPWQHTEDQQNIFPSEIRTTPSLPRMINDYICINPELEEQQTENEIPPKQILTERKAIFTGTQERKSHAQYALQDYGTSFENEKSYRIQNLATEIFQQRKAFPEVYYYHKNVYQGELFLGDLPREILVAGKPAVALLEKLIQLNLDQRITLEAMATNQDHHEQEMLVLDNKTQKLRRKCDKLQFTIDSIYENYNLEMSTNKEITLEEKLWKRIIKLETKNHSMENALDKATLTLLDQKKHTETLQCRVNEMRMDYAWLALQMPVEDQIPRPDFEENNANNCSPINIHLLEKHEFDYRVYPYRVFSHLAIKIDKISPQIVDEYLSLSLIQYMELKQEYWDDADPTETWWKADDLPFSDMKNTDGELYAEKVIYSQNQKIVHSTTTTLNEKNNRAATLFTDGYFRAPQEWQIHLPTPKEPWKECSTQPKRKIQTTKVPKWPDCANQEASVKLFLYQVREIYEYWNFAHRQLQEHFSLQNLVIKLYKLLMKFNQKNGKTNTNLPENENWSISKLCRHKFRCGNVLIEPELHTTTDDLYISEIWEQLVKITTQNSKLNQQILILSNEAYKHPMWIDIIHYINHDMWADLNSEQIPHLVKQLKNVYKSQRETLKMIPLYQNPITPSPTLLNLMWT